MLLRHYNIVFTVQLLVMQHTV